PGGHVLGPQCNLRKLATRLSKVSFRFGPLRSVEPSTVQSRHHFWTPIWGNSISSGDSRPSSTVNSPELCSAQCGSERVTSTVLAPRIEVRRLTSLTAASRSCCFPRYFVCAAGLFCRTWLATSRRSVTLPNVVIALAGLDDRQGHLHLRAV